MAGENSSEDITGMILVSAAVRCASLKKQSSNREAVRHWLVVQLEAMEQRRYICTRIEYARLDLLDSVDYTLCMEQSVVLLGHLWKSTAYPKPKALSGYTSRPY